MTDQDTKTALEAVVRDYLDGMIHGDRAKLERAMHPRCMQAGHFGGVYEYLDREAFIASVTGETASPPGTPYDYEIVSCDTVGNVAVVKVEDACFGTRFTDFLTLIRDGGRWQIVMKAFYDHADD